MKHAEQTLLIHLCDADSLDYLAREGLLTELGREVIPTEFVQRLVKWALDEFFTSGRTVAPSLDAVRETWGDLLEQHEVTLDAETEPDSVQWALADLRANHARLEGEAIIQDFAKDLTTADGPDRVKTFLHYADKMFLTAQALISRRHEMTGAQGVQDAELRLEERIRTGHVTRGLLMGIPEIDAHTHGTHPGEITTVGGSPGAGKSWLAGFIALRNFEAGKRVLLVTLENDVPMTYDRLCCMACGIPYDRWQRGEVSDAQPLDGGTSQRQAVRELLERMQGSEVQPIFVQLDLDQRTASGIIRKAILEGADGVIIDQLNFVRSESTRRDARRFEQVSEIMPRLKQLANEGATQIPVILLSQMKREGIAAARKNGKFHMDDFADSTSVEQTSDGAWAIYRDADMLRNFRARLQHLKARRTVLRDFELIWHPEVGKILLDGAP
jgi:replicative DNA helicase